MMKCQSDIKRIAEQKMAAARCLMAGGLWDDAYYLAGYGIELYLKAMICKTLKVDDFFAFDKKDIKKEIYKPYKNHNYLDLLLLSGIFQEFEIALVDTRFFAKWSIVSKWDEGSRYLCDQSPDAVKEFVNL